MSIKHLEMSGPSITKDEIKHVIDAMKNGWYGRKKFYYVETFEKIFAKFHGRKYGLMVPNCTQALHLILYALGIKRGDNVINQECTWVAPAAAVLYVGAKNKFADINSENWCMDENSLSRLIDKNTKAAIVSDIYGNMPNMSKIKKICKEKKIHLLEDAAEALGSTYRGTRAGKFGIASAFSFHRTKTVTTGEGGMIVTDNKKLFKRCKFLRDQGRDSKSTYVINELGFKFMPFNLQAALGYSQFKRLAQIIKKKRWIYSSYRKEFFENKNIQFNMEDKNVKNGCWATTMVIGKEYKISTNRIIKELKIRKIASRPFFMPLSSMKPFYSKSAKNRNLVAYDISQRAVTLPSPLNIKLSQIKKYSEVIKIILEKNVKT